MSADLDAIRAEAMSLPLTHKSLVGLIALAESFANAMKTQCDVTGMEEVCEFLLDACIASESVFAVTLEDRNERALSRMVEERYER